MSAVNLEMKSDGWWVLANINVTGYYRVNYDDENWEQLLAQLNSEHQVQSDLFQILLSHGVKTFVLIFSSAFQYF